MGGALEPFDKSYHWWGRGPNFVREIPTAERWRSTMRRYWLCLWCTLAMVAGPSLSACGAEGSRRFNPASDRVVAVSGPWVVWLTTELIKETQYKIVDSYVVRYYLQKSHEEKGEFIYN